MNDRKHTPEESSAELAPPTASLSCFLCEQDENGGGRGARLEGPGVGEVTMAPNRAVAALLGNFNFRRQCIEGLKRISIVLWQDGLT